MVKDVLVLILSQWNPQVTGIPRVKPTSYRQVTMFYRLFFVTALAVVENVGRGPRSTPVGAQPEPRELRRDTRATNRPLPLSMVVGHDDNPAGH